MEVQTLTIKTLRDQVDNLFVYEVRREGDEPNHYFGSTLNDNDELRYKLRDLGFEIHDFYYESGYNCKDAIDDYLSTFDQDQEIIKQELENIFSTVYREAEPDVYYGELTKWLNDAPNGNIHYLDEFLIDGRVRTGFDLLQSAQLKQIKEIYSMVFEVVRMLGGTI
jgi:hypothetical protein